MSAAPSVGQLFIGRAAIIEQHRQHIRTDKSGKSKSEMANTSGRKTSSKRPSTMRAASTPSQHNAAAAATAAHGVAPRVAGCRNTHSQAALAKKSCPRAGDANVGSVPGPTGTAAMDRPEPAREAPENTPASQPARNLLTPWGGHSGVGYPIAEKLRKEGQRCEGNNSFYGADTDWSHRWPLLRAELRRCWLGVSPHDSNVVCCHRGTEAGTTSCSLI